MQAPVEDGGAVQGMEVNQPPGCPPRKIEDPHKSPHKNAEIGAKGTPVFTCRTQARRL